MSEERTINCEGQSGTNYEYWIYPIGTTFKPSPANYVFAIETTNGFLRPVYIGQTGDISKIFDEHHNMPCIKHNGATHICIHDENTTEEERIIEEFDLIAKYKPICNL